MEINSTFSHSYHFFVDEFIFSSSPHPLYLLLLKTRRNIFLAQSRSLFALSRVHEISILLLLPWICSYPFQCESFLFFVGQKTASQTNETLERWWWRYHATWQFCTVRAEQSKSCRNARYERKRDAAASGGEWVHVIWIFRSSRIFLRRHFELRQLNYAWKFFVPFF